MTTRTDDARIVLPDGAAVPARIPAGIFAAAVDTFVAGQRLDMRSLARRLGVARATLYRRGRDPGGPLRRVPLGGGPPPPPGPGQARRGGAGAPPAGAGGGGGGAAR